MARRAQPERYLRSACEEVVRTDPRRGPGPADQASAVARVLLAARSIDQATVGLVFEKYRLGCEALQKPSPSLVHLSAAQRVVVGTLAVGEDAEGLVLREALFDEEGTQLEFLGDAAGRLGAAMAQGGLGHGRSALAASREPTVVDDHGGAATARSRHERNWGTGWEGTYVTDKPLSASTAWLEVDGAHVDLPPPRPVPEGRTEVLPAPARPLEAALWHELVRSFSLHHWRGNALEAAMTALVATGVLTEDDAVLKETARIAGAMKAQRLDKDLPEPWASVLKRAGRQDGPVGTVPIGTALSSEEGWSVRFGSLWSESSSFSLSVAASPGLSLVQRRTGRLEVNIPTIEWWAEDELGNNYLANSS